MTDLRKAAEMALEVFEHLSKGESPAITRGELVYEIAALRQALAMENFSEVNQEIEQALAQPEQEAIKQAYLDGVNSGIKAEREACAMVCESMPTPKHATTLTHAPTLETCAAAIRARGNHD